MRITAQEKAQTRERILKAARELFTSQGVEATTTRHIARAAGIASGTLFNYFQTKEEIAAELVGEALDKARDDFAARRRDGEGLDERLFDFVAAGLRRLRPVRRLVPAVLELALAAGPAGNAAGGSRGGALRAGQLEVVEQILSDGGRRPAPSGLALQLFWTLYAGVLAAWAADRSPKQEDTLALIDQSVRMFVQWHATAGEREREEE